MSMRKWKRGIARYRMELCGYDRINKKRFRESKKNKKGEERTYLKSAFALNWRKILDPESKQYKSFIRMKKRLDAAYIQRDRIAQLANAGKKAMRKNGAVRVGG